MMITFQRMAFTPILGALFRPPAVYSTAEIITQKIFVATYKCFTEKIIPVKKFFCYNMQSLKNLLEEFTLTNTQEIMNRDDKNYLPVFNRYKIVLDRGEGVYLYDVTGKKYIDFLAGIAVNVLGHNYKPLVDAISKQAAKVIHVSNLYYTEPQANAAAKLVKLSGLDRAFFANSGAEANEDHSLGQFSRQDFSNFDCDRSTTLSQRF